MLIYKDVITGDELISDAYEMKEVEGGLLYEVECKMITIKKGGGDVNIGANASAEEAAEELDDSQERVIDAVHAFRLTTTPIVTDQDTFKHYMMVTKKGSGYLKRIHSYLGESGAPKEEIKAFAAGAKRVYSGIKDRIPNTNPVFYVGEGGADNGMVVLLEWRNNETTPVLIFWKHGLKAEKY